MIEDYQVERKIILNENDSRAMSSSRFTVNKKVLHWGSTSIFYVSTCFRGNVAINIDWG